VLTGEPVCQSSTIYEKGKEELKNIGVHLRPTTDVLEEIY